VTDYFIHLIKTDQVDEHANFLAIRKMKSDWGMLSPAGFRNTQREDRMNTVHMLDRMDFGKLESKFGDSNPIRDLQGEIQQPCNRPSLFNQLHNIKKSPMIYEDHPTGSGGLGTNNFNFKGLNETSPGKNNKRKDSPKGFDDDLTTKGGYPSKSIILSYVDEVKSNSKHAMPPEPKRVLDSSEGQILISDPDFPGMTGSCLLNGPLQAEYMQQKYLPTDD
jgi:hypothetical protein